MRVKTLSIIIFLSSITAVINGQKTAESPMPTPTTYPFEEVVERTADNDDEYQREGPANLQQYNLFSSIDDDVDFKNTRQLHINEYVYRDENIKSGYYYFLPNEYNLSFESNTGKYGINVNYGMGDGSSAGDITVTAILEPDFNETDWEIAKHLLEKQIKGKAEEKYGVVELLPVPYNEAPTVEFENLFQYGVDEKDVSVRITDKFTDPIYISFRTNKIEELMNIFLNDIGLFGNVFYYPTGSRMPQSIPIKFNLKIDSHKTFGDIEINQSTWARNSFENKFDFPIIVKKLHVLKTTDTGAKIYTWDAGNTEVPEKAKIKFDNSKFPKSLATDRSVEKMWLEYEVKPCKSCNRVVEQKIDKGVGAAKRQAIEVINLNALNKTGGEIMKVYFRSTQASPNSTRKTELPSITITEDGETYMSQPLIIQEGQKADYEYRIKIFLTDGSPLESDWIRGKNLVLFFNESSLKKILPELRK